MIYLKLYLNKLLIIGITITNLLLSVQPNMVNRIICVLFVILILLLNINKKEYYIFSFLSIFLISIVGSKNIMIFFSFTISIILTCICRKNIKNIIKDKLFLIYVVFYINILITYKIAINKEDAFISVYGYLTLLLIIYSLGLLLYEYKLNTILLFKLISYINLNIGLIFWLNNFNKIGTTHRALLFLNGNNGVKSNTLGGIIAVLFPCLIVGYSICKSKIYYILNIIISLSVLLVLQSRGAYVGLAIVLLLMVYKWNLINKFKVIYLALLGLIIIFLLYPEIFHEFFGRFNFSGVDDISNGRFELYISSLKIFSENFLIGTGMYQLGYYLGTNNELVDPHNFIITYLQSTGIIGFSVFMTYLYFIFSKIKISIKTCHYSQENILMLRYCGYVALIHGFLEPTMTTNAPLILFTIITSTYYYSKNNELLNLKKRSIY